MLRTLSDETELDGRVVFLRVDANVPLDDGVISDDGRIRAFVPTLEWLLTKGAAVVVASHLGRPSGPHDSGLSLSPVAERLSALLNKPVPLIPGVSGQLVWSSVDALLPGQVCMVENLRFDPRETSKEPAERLELALEWADHVDVTVVDAFGVVHRKQSSVYELPSLTTSYAGFLVAKEVEVLTALTSEPERPYTVVLGGSKVSDKLGVIEALLPSVDHIVIGGGMVFTILKAQGFEVGASLLEKDMVETSKRFLAQAGEHNVTIHVPSDIVMAEGFSPTASHEVLGVAGLATGPAGAQAMGLDIGPASAQEFAAVVSSSKTVFWNGPMGVFEFEAFSHGTRVLAEALTKVKGLSVVGGGDSASAVRSLGFDESAFGHISTGGGASLEFLEGSVLPGLEILGWQQ